MTADRYLKSILQREAVDTSSASPVINVQDVIEPIIIRWAGNRLVGVNPSGSFAKGTANDSGTDIDLFVSLSSNTSETLKYIYNSLCNVLQNEGYSPRKQNVSLGIRVGMYDVDIIPAKRQDQYSNDHSLYRRKADTWTKTNITNHISLVRKSNRIDEIRIIKLWRNQKGIDFPSFYLELATIQALYYAPYNDLASNVLKVFSYLESSFISDRFIDPANSNNVISDDLSLAEKSLVAIEAQKASLAKYWSDIVR